MTEWLRCLFLGLVQGVTEFLPISSDGHLSLFQILTSPQNGSTSESGADFVFFDVMLHLGTTCAILIYYRRYLWRACEGLLGRAEADSHYSRSSLVRLLALAFVATLPLGPVKLFFVKSIKELYHNLPAVGIGFLITATVLALTGWVRGGTKGPRETTWTDALLIGMAQALAPLPGVSRSGLTVAAALLLGLSRAWAVGFSLLIAVPAILAAVASELIESSPSSLSAERWGQVALATLVAGVVGYFAIVWLVRIVGANRLWYFSVYLFLLGAIILLVLVPRFGGATQHNAPPATLDGGTSGRPVESTDRLGADDRR
jgi:undecaprenyl-diphosphatase